MSRFIVDDKVKPEVFVPSGGNKFSPVSFGLKPESKFIQGSPNLADPKESFYFKHSFVLSCLSAYSYHYNLVIRPDDIWIAIITQFSMYVDLNAEKLRDRFVDFQGQKELTVTTAGTLHTVDFGALSRRMEEQIAKNIKDPSIREWVVPGFSTTSPIDRVVGAVILMATMKNYFSYKFELCCGLPSITLLGTIDDWKEIRHRAERIVEFDTGDKKMFMWREMLLPVLDQFINTASGNCDKEWWNRIANKQGGGSGPRFLSGWVTVFCVFSDEKKWMGDDRGDWICVNINDIPKGYLSVPVKVDDNGTEYRTQMFAGHIVARTADEGTTLIPQLDWCMLIPEERKIEKK
eukprot:TRINITY_DN2465_c0_g2_i2.p1 TRINITY_DN2465_c0_g2~~TRINITY_DN2465_c0_g2_i2.p1  ORF type:complete len:348 (+),score=58.04 TRINITY_DN2465_c0_g2_i2:176-1219(+)